MPRLPFLRLGSLPFAALLAASCSQNSVPLSLVMVAPQALGDAESVDLYVYEAVGAECAEDGSVGEIPTEASKFSLTKDGCGEGLSWCAEIEVERTDNPTMFAAVARAQGQTLLQGCTITPVNQDPLDVTIEMKQFIEPKCCGDGKLQPGEQCDPGGSAECGGVIPDEVCNPDCTTAEVLLSVVDNAKPFMDNLPVTKSELQMAFCPGNSQTGTALRTVFRSADGKANNMSDINLRVMSPDGYTIINPQPLSLQLRLPVPCYDIYETAEGGVERTPAIAAVAQNSTLMVYASNIKVSSSSDIYLIEHTEDVCADVPLNSNPAVQLSKTVSAPGSITPDVARGPDGSALIVWEQKGDIQARIWNNGALIPPFSETALSIGKGALPKVAGNGSGWVVVYQGPGDAEDIFKRTVDLQGVSGAELRVNGQTGGPQILPDIAMLDSGNYAVVWESAGDVFFQRYLADGTAVAGDQDAPLNTDKGGNQFAVSIAAPTSGGTFFAAVWENDDATISARFLGEKSGFLFNSVDGRNTSFQASPPGAIGLRHKPTVAIGNHVMFGWQDDSQEHPGVYIRRFPLPN
ncbi:MAG: hypothetical protein IPK82_25405 [Polyangiaceae bacterium]|nr:hypothetical protein [Polyangiaceae bacterium]